MPSFVIHQESITSVHKFCYTPTLTVFMALTLLRIETRPALAAVRNGVYPNYTNRTIHEQDIQLPGERLLYTTSTVSLSAPNLTRRRHISVLLLPLDRWRAVSLYNRQIEKNHTHAARDSLVFCMVTLNLCRNTDICLYCLCLISTTQRAHRDSSHEGKRSYATR